MITERKIDKQIWEIFEILRGNIGSHDYHIILLFISLYKDDQINKDDLIDEKQDIESRLKIAASNSDNPIQEYSQIIECFSPSLSNLRNMDFSRLVITLFQIDKEILKEKFSEIFDATLYQIAESQGKKSGEFFQPKELTHLICSLANLPAKSRIFNPFAGTASFSVFFNKDQNYFGQEINQQTWAIGTLRIMAYNNQILSNYKCKDSIVSWPDQSEKFDLIISNPPFGLRLYNDLRESGGIRSVERFLLEKGLNSLTAKGKLIALLPYGFLFRGGLRPLRERLIESGLVDTIISLPSGLLINTGIPLVILVINKCKENPAKVRFVEAKNFISSTSHPQQGKILDLDKINKLLQGVDKNSDVVRIIDNTQIKELDYNLDVKRYFQEHIEGTSLGDILDSYEVIRSNVPKTGKLIRIRDLINDKIDYNLDLSAIEENELNSNHSREIKESCLLLANKWKTLKPTLFEFSKTSIFINPNITAFKINEKKVDKAYLINELHADYVLKQLDAVRLGATIPYIRKGDLLKVVLKLPSLKEQRAKMQGITELSEKIKSLQDERNKLAHGIKITQFNEFASLKHTLGRPRQNILDWSDNLIDFLDKNSEIFDTLNNEFHQYYQLDIISALKEMKADVNFMSDVLEKGERGLVVEQYDKTIIPLSDMNSLINKLSSNGFNFNIKKLLNEEEKLKDRGVLGNLILFKTLIDNLLTNANKYAFEKEESVNEVVFELNEVSDFLLIEVRNNGVPFPKNFDKEKFITKYSTADSKSGSGLGGYDIHRIAAEFGNPDWQLLLNTDPIYPVKFKFQFPIKIIN